MSLPLCLSTALLKKTPDIFYSILLASPVTDPLIINKCLVGTGAPTAVSQLQWSRSLQDM